MALFAAVLLLVGCDESGPSGPGGDGNQDGVDALPPVLAMNGSAAVSLEDGTSASCEYFFHIELEEQSDTVAEQRTYRGTMSGEALRAVNYPDETGFQLWPLMHSAATVRVWDDSIEFAQDGHDTVSAPFYSELMYFRGERTSAAESQGDWVCAPVGIAEEGLVDTSVVATGSWTVTEIEE